MTSAPRVNQMRFLSSSALEKADQLMLAASCSAADAIVYALRQYRGAGHAPLERPAWLRSAATGYRRNSNDGPSGAPRKSYGPSAAKRHPLRAALRQPAATASALSVLTLPPAFSTAATALFDAP